MTPSSPGPLIRIDSLGKSLPGSDGPQVVLRDISFSVDRGQTVSILGRSGSGKSTLLSLLALLDKHDSGTYEFDGTDVATLSDREACRLRSDQFGFVFQRFFLLKHLTAEQNVALSLLNGQPPSCSRRGRHRRAMQALDLVGIAHLAHRRPPALSGGEQQRVAIARVLVREPSVVFADEPTGALDNHTGEEIVEVPRLHARGTAVIMVTHDHQYAQRLDRVVVLDDGQLGESPRASGPILGRRRWRATR